MSGYMTSFFSPPFFQVVFRKAITRLMAKIFFPLLVYQSIRLRLLKYQHFLDYIFLKSFSLFVSHFWHSNTPIFRYFSSVTNICLCFIHAFFFPSSVIYTLRSMKLFLPTVRSFGMLVSGSYT